MSSSADCFFTVFMLRMETEECLFSSRVLILDLALPMQPLYMQYSILKYSYLVLHKSFFVPMMVLQLYRLFMPKATMGGPGAMVDCDDVIECWILGLINWDMFDVGWVDIRLE